MSADAWWRYGTIYQIYPRSFQDTDGDGIGDLKGITARLDYLVALGVDAVWISPIYPSPMADFGYDVSDYCDIDPMFGSLADFDALIAATHARGLRLILDYVPNHTSDQHPWFLESRASRDNPRRHWYLWRDAAGDGGPPNNWLSNFGGPAWTFDAQSGQYYLHSFLAQQPDLNWRNPEVRAAMYEVLRFWLRRGVDGIRVDVIYHLIKDAQYRDNPLNPGYRPGGDPAHRLLPQHTIDQPEVQEIVVEMRDVLKEFDSPQTQRLLIGEIYLPIERLAAYYGPKKDGALQGAQLPFNFNLIGVPWNASAIDALIRKYESILPPGGAPNWVLGNHDKPRIATRVGPESARLAAKLLLTLRGTPTLYYGDEIGMTDVPIAPDQVQDPFEKNQPGKGLGRDPQRTPMRWSDAPGAGFTTGTPWLPLGADAAGEGDVAAQEDSDASMLAFYRALLALRRKHACLNQGRWEPVGVEGDLLAYARILDQGEPGSPSDERALILLNFGAAPVVVPEAWVRKPMQLLLSTVAGRHGRIGPGDSLGPHEGVVLGL